MVAKQTCELIEIVTAEEDEIRDRSLDEVCKRMSLPELMSACQDLDEFWRKSTNLYQRVRALLFLSTIYRFHLPGRLEPEQIGCISFDSYDNLLARRFQESVDHLLFEQKANGVGVGPASALSTAYRELAFQTLADQVRRSVRSVKGNQWMFRLGHPDEQPLRIRSELLTRSNEKACYPVLCEKTPVRMDFSHSGWSDIFFLGMDFPAGARVLNASIDLAVFGRDDTPRPPIETYLRVIDQPILRLVSVDLGAHVELTQIPEVFDFARDYLGLVKAAIIAAGIVPPGMEGCEQPIAQLLEPMLGKGLGLEVVSKVNNIPKGSRLAVSTNLLGSLISLCMRATGQVANLDGGLQEQDRRIVAARAILGEWLGGSGGGWQDSGGVWPGIKLIRGEVAGPGDPEQGVSRGRLLPVHHVFDETEISPETRRKLQQSLVLVHGGMAQNVGPILEMVTEKYLLRSSAEWEARGEAIAILEEISQKLKEGDIRGVGAATTRNFMGPLQTIIPWCTNAFTNNLIERARDQFGERFWGFWMLGGMSGGGMGFLFDPEIQSDAVQWMGNTLSAVKRELQDSLPFAMEPVVYDFRINERGTWSELRSAVSSMPDEYYGLMVPGWLRTEPRDLSPAIRTELENLGDAHLATSDSNGLGRALLTRLLPHSQAASGEQDSLAELLSKHGFDREQHEWIRDELRQGRIGLSQNRLASTTRIEDVSDADFVDARSGVEASYAELGKQSIRRGEAAVVTLAAGAGSRWTGGAGVVKALHPFCQFAGRHRSFLDVHLAKTNKCIAEFDAKISHVMTTGYLTDEPIRAYLQRIPKSDSLQFVTSSPGKTVGLRMIPTVRDLLFAWEEMPQQVLDEQQQKVRMSLRAALMEWAREAGEASDYTDNLPLQCLHPVGHWYEIPNLIRNGTLLQLLSHQPDLRYLLLHNIDTLGANLDPGMLGLHIDGQACLSFEVINRRLEDRGGGLARVDGRPRLVEGLAMPREQDEFKLRFYNSLTTWISIDPLLEFFGLERHSLSDSKRVDQAIRSVSQRLPTYITIKDVKKRWGHGHEDVFPITQFEKLWGDMSGLPEVTCQFVAVPIQRGQQLKDPAQLDGWLRDGSASYVDALCRWQQKP